MFSNNNIENTKTHDELVQFIESKLDELMIILFMGHCSLFDMEQGEKK